MGMKKILGCIRKADNDFSMIKAGDRICVGVSGGKDSTLLLYALHLYRKFVKYDFEIIGVNIILGFPGMDFTELKKWAEENDIKFVQYPSEVYEILKANANPDGTIKCSLCSKFKKALVIDAAKDHDCNIVAFGHHSDDAVETIFMNSIFGGRLATFLPVMYLDRSDITFIRPLIYAYESDIINAVASAKLPIVPSTCPMDKHTQREEVKSLLADIYRKYPTARSNFQYMLSNTEQVSLWDKANHKEDFLKNK